MIGALAYALQIGATLYALRVVGASALLFAYYCLFLRNRPFHRWNRGFLLGLVLFSLGLPFVPMPELGWFGMGEGPAFQGILHAVVPGNWDEGAGAGGSGVAATGGGWEWGRWLVFAYGLVAAVLGSLFVRELLYILRLYRRHPREQWGDIRFLLTREPGTPFSFWKTIFWNQELAIDSAEGRQVLRHELVHVRRGHTIDVLLLRGVMILFWCNPIFYFVYRELRTIHEFEADAGALAIGDRYTYAELLVWQTLGHRRGSLFHHFFSSSIKRRITMITKIAVTRPGRWSRWMVAPLAVLLFCAFSAKMDRVRSKPITVVIDAGHGGLDDGAIGSGGLKEKDINLSIALKVKQLASSYGVNVVLTRDGDELAGGGDDKQRSLHYRSDLAAAKNADLFISLHVNTGGGVDAQGFQIFVSRQNALFDKSTKLGGALLEALKPSYTVGNALREREEGIWVLKAATVPAVLVECGSMEVERDRAFITDPANQETIAGDILKGIVQFGK